jgi:hypothetical protein
VTAGSNDAQSVYLDTTTGVPLIGPNVLDYSPPPNNVRNALDGSFGVAFALPPTLIA